MIFLESHPQSCLNPPLPLGFSCPPENGWYYENQWFRECLRCDKDKPLFTHFKQTKGIYSLVCLDCKATPKADTQQCFRNDCDRAYQELPLSDFAKINGMPYPYCRRCQSRLTKTIRDKKQGKSATVFDCRCCKQPKALLDYNLVTRLKRLERDLTCSACRVEQKKLLRIK